MTRSFSVEQQVAIVTAYRDGGTLRSVALTQGCDPRLIRGILREHNVPVVKRSAVGYTQVQREAMVNAYRSGDSIDMIVDRLGVSSRKVVCNVLRDAGVRMRSKTWQAHITDRVLEYQSEIIRAYGSGETLAAISVRLNLGYSAVRNLLIRRGVNMRPGGRPKTRGGLRGQYMAVWIKPEDPMWSMAQGGNPAGGYVLEHRLVMARSLGRPLEPHETVHHINGQKTDNRLENLQLRTGRHGKGVRAVCLDCGSHNIKHADL